uniref:Uncharacterized protein n=1 Tax=Heterorhabditis bacteriophora TaxID=37862 RepID=A0A1I7XAU0_HETBA
MGLGLADTPKRTKQALKTVNVTPAKQPLERPKKERKPLYVPPPPKDNVEKLARLNAAVQATDALSVVLSRTESQREQLESRLTATRNQLGQLPIYQFPLFRNEINASQSIIIEELRSRLVNTEHRYKLDLDKIICHGEQVDCEGRRRFPINICILTADAHQGNKFTSNSTRIQEQRNERVATKISTVSDLKNHTNIGKVQFRSRSSTSEHRSSTGVGARLSQSSFSDFERSVDRDSLTRSTVSMYTSQYRLPENHADDIIYAPDEIITGRGSSSRLSTSLGEEERQSKEVNSRYQVFRMF